MRVAHLVETHRHWSEGFVWDLLLEDATHIAVARRSQQPSRVERATLSPFVWEEDDWIETDPRPRCSAEEMWAWYRSVLREEAPDVIHVHFATEAVKLAPVLRSSTIPVVVSVYGGDLCFELADASRRKRAVEAFATATVIAICQYLSHQVALLGFDSIVVPLAAPETCQPPSNMRPRVGPLRLLAVGRFVEKKGFSLLLKALSLVQQPFHLSLFGTGPLEEELRRLVVRLGLRQSVTFAGRCSRSTVLDAIASADALVCPSRTADNGDEEGTPTVLLEAQSFGLPVVASSHAGIPEVISPENRPLLFPEGNLIGLVKALGILLERHKSFKQDATRDWIHSHHARSTIHDRLLRVYHSTRAGAPE